jgi:Alpha/beta hydrolase domain
MSILSRTGRLAGWTLGLLACAPIHGAGAPVKGAHEAVFERVTRTDAPFGSGREFLAGRGFVEEEFIVRGKARRFRISEPSVNARVMDAGHPYATRALVRRPTDPARFNGTVIVEWFNVSTGQDIDFVYAATRELLVREGYAWIGVSAQRNGLDALKKWNPARYGSLSLVAPVEDPRTGKPADITTLGMPPQGDVLSWDVYSAIGMAARNLRSPLLGGLPAKRVLAVGESQSAFRLSYYFNVIQPLEHAYDGFLLYDRGGPFALRTDVASRLLSVGTEFMVDLIGGSPADAVNQRWWEIAGASHVSVEEMDGYIDMQVRRDATRDAASPAPTLTAGMLSTGSCTTTPVWSRVPNGDIMKAALKSLNMWVAGGPAAVNTPRLVVNEQHKLVRDEHARVLGGIRTAAYDAPRALNHGSNGAGSCMLAGYHLDLDEPQMCRIYGSRAGYVDRVRAVAMSNTRDGVLLPEEAQKTISEAQLLGFDCAAAANP